MIHAVDRLALAEEINRRGERLGRQMPILLEVNIGGEATKSGFTPQVLQAEIEQFVAMPHVQVRGLMTIPPPTPTPEGARPFYQALRQLRDNLRQRGIEGIGFYRTLHGDDSRF